jgi:methionyl-tRNA formyltransferase
MRMIKAMDAGEIFAQKPVNITLEDTASTLHDKLILCAQELCNEQLMNVLENRWFQDHKMIHR